jgi:ABC-2 type transport system permease protein
MNVVSWLVRREFWENRAIWLIPAVFGALLILASLFGGYQFLAGADFATARAVVQAGALPGVAVIAAAFFVLMCIYSSWYLLDCLYADRKDRSILFWKSMPISDTATVLSKLGMALFVIPLVYWLLADLTTLLAAFVISVRTSSYEGSSLWRGDLWLQIQGLWLYVIVTAAIWYLPVAGWLLVVSAWAKRAVILWSILPPLAVLIVEKPILHTHVIGNLIESRIDGYLDHALQYTASDANWTTTVVGHLEIITPTDLWRFLSPAGFFSSVDTWIGAAIGAALIACAIQLRMRRAEI